MQTTSAACSAHRNSFRRGRTPLFSACPRTKNHSPFSIFGLVKKPGLKRLAKGLLISGLDARLHTGQLRFAAELQEARPMAEELKDFRRRVSAAGRFTFEARVGQHDDLVLAVAIGLWVLAGRPRPPTAAFGTYSVFAK